MASAVTKYQQAMGLPVTGQVDGPTLALMARPRCGNPDVGAARAARYSVQPPGWQHHDITYNIVEFNPKISEEAQRLAFRGAFDRWQAVIPLDFTEIPKDGLIQISWFKWDGPGKALARTQYPTDSGKPVTSRYDPDDSWPSNRLNRVALHEFGHAIGLGHSDDPRAVMYATLNDTAELTRDDVQGAQVIYGPRYGWPWRSLGGEIYEPTVGANLDGRLEVFGVGMDSEVHQIWQVAPNSVWSAWGSLGANVLRQLAVGRNQDGRLELFAVTGDNSLAAIWQTRPNNGWSHWGTLGGNIHSPTTIRTPGGRQHVFACTPGGALIHVAQTKPSNGWGTWEPLNAGTIRPPITVALDKAGWLQVFAVGTDGALHLLSQNPSGPGWHPWKSLGGKIINPVVGTNADGRLEVFGTGPDKSLHHIWQKPDGSWSGWGTRGGHAIQPAVARNKDGRLTVCARNAGDQISIIEQTAPNNGWGSWFSIPGPRVSEGPVIAANQDGRLEIFVRGDDGALWHLWQTAPSGYWLDL
ncbi:hypothetical protein Acor_08780 [Acrocarpospora corrugata]|uniref:Peptidase metallopeptidase domain-containing protein n=2 Tax=Acrocarpospora corrugata TaxID=35763 RepID=A0A5M3VPV0_9ACTN|nr:hypothetical protein Acor_08780 [Acrocarpospora corrugata]